MQQAGVEPEPSRVTPLGIVGRRGQIGTGIGHQGLTLVDRDGRGRLGRRSGRVAHLDGDAVGAGVGVGVLHDDRAPRVAAIGRITVPVLHGVGQRIAVGVRRGHGDPDLRPDGGLARGGRNLRGRRMVHEEGEVWVAWLLPLVGGDRQRIRALARAGAVPGERPGSVAVVDKGDPSGKCPGDGERGRRDTRRPVTVKDAEVPAMKVVEVAE